jgi:hypothetical protein
MLSTMMPPPPLPFLWLCSREVGLMGLGCGKKQLSKVAEILEILAGQVLARLDGVVVLQTMIER